jgi:3-(3-hydroxy-phenyl)propionate hydroxylase
MPGEEPEAMQRPDRVFELLASWLPPGSAEIERSAVYTFHGLLAKRWRAGRVLIAGDAAHQMPPFLGQGMCSGLRDATNLAWKLDCVIRDGAPAELLDTYEVERKPHVRSIIGAAVEYGRLTCETDPVLAAERDRRWLSDPAHPARKLRFSLPALTPGPMVLKGGGELFVQPISTGTSPRLDDVVGRRFFVVGRQPLKGAAGTWWRDRAGAVVAAAGDLPEFRDQLVLWLDLHE